MVLTICADSVSFTRGSFFPWTTISGVTTTGTGITMRSITYRNVAHLGKIVATLDVLSGGRAVCGLGIGWFEAEHHAYGWPFPTTDERYAQILAALLAQLKKTS